MSQRLSEEAGAQTANARLNALAAQLGYRWASQLIYL